ncbi:MAG: PcfJ domain-containing protein [Chitinophagales bacterium]|nr:PcfJ domain-containing protein [Hyphomicrobiales bacterium]
MGNLATPAPAVEARAPFESHLRRFERGYRRRLRKLAKMSPWLGDLLYAFPGAAVAMVAGDMPASDRVAAIGFVKDGRPLRDVAGALGIPYWMKRLPPEAFSDPLRFPPIDAAFDRRIVNLIPTSITGMPMWLRWVADGANSCGLDFAEWLAIQKIYEGESDSAPLLPLAAYAWFSGRDTPVRSLIGQHWRAMMPFAYAIEMAATMLEAMIDYCGRESLSAGEGWRKIRKCGNHSFVPLMKPDDLREEGKKMRNCVASYAPRVASGRSLIYSVRRSDVRVATLEIAAAHGRNGGLAIVQLAGPENADVTKDVRAAADAWFAVQRKLPPPSFRDEALLCVRADKWEAIWAPYWDAKPQLKAEINNGARTLIRLRNDVAALRRIAKPTG